jgi:hypothetical protein
VVTLPTPYGLSDLGNIRTDQSADVVYLACKGFQQRKHRAPRHPPECALVVGGALPAGGRPVQAAERLPDHHHAQRPITGNITLTASARAVQRRTRGRAVRLTSSGQSVTATGAANGVTTSPRSASPASARIAPSPS